MLKLSACSFPAVFFGMFNYGLFSYGNNLVSLRDSKIGGNVTMYHHVIIESNYLFIDFNVLNVHAFPHTFSRVYYLLLLQVLFRSTSRFQRFLSRNALIQSEPLT